MAALFALKILTTLANKGYILSYYGPLAYIHIEYNGLKPRY